MKSLRLILPSLLFTTLFLASSAFAQDVSYNFDKTVDFTRYKTIHWERHPNSADIGQLTITQLGEALDTGAKPKKRQKNMAKGAEKLLKNYPPVVKK